MSRFTSNKQKLGFLILIMVLTNALAQEIDWYSLDSGGGQSSANGIEIWGVMGQTDTRQMEGGDIILSGGYLPLPDNSDVIFKDSFES